VPGFTVAPNYVATQRLTVRGITTGGSTNPTVGVTVDDVPFTGSIGNGGTGGLGVPDIDPGELQQIEVLRGPQGTLYGASSMGGLVKYVTKDPSVSGFSARVEGGLSSVKGGNDPGYTVRASANIPLGETFALRVSGFTRQDPGYIDNVFLGDDDINKGQSDGARVSALWKPSETTSLKLSALYQKSTLDGLNEVVVQSGLSGLEQNYVKGAGQDERKISAFTAVFKAGLGSVDLTSVTGYNENNDTNSLDFGFAFSQAVENFAGQSGAVYTDRRPSSKFSQELRFAGALGERVDWLLGGFYTHERSHEHFTVDSRNPVTGEIAGIWFDGIEDGTAFDDTAAFADLTYRFTDRFDVQVGGRQSHLKTEVDRQSTRIGTDPIGYVDPRRTTDDVFTYLLTPRLKVTPDLMLYARFASGYRAGSPNIAQAGIPSGSSPDKTQNYELGAKADFLDHRLSIDASIYHIDWKDIQLQIIDPATSISYAGNGGAAKSEGVEFSVDVRPMTGLTVASWVAYDKAELTENFVNVDNTCGLDGDRLPHTPRISANLSLQQEFPLFDKFTGFAGGAASYVGERFGQFTGSCARQRFPSYTKADLRLGVRTDSWTANLYINNVSDERGLLDGGTGYFYSAARIYITPRTVGLTVSKLF
jgi:outer membrane receptor protein involved in Fe transport